EDYSHHPKLRGVCCSLASGIPAGLDSLARLNLALDLELQSSQFPLIQRIAGTAPRIAIDHLGSPSFGSGPTAEWLSGMEAAARLPNVFCKISGLLTDQR